jgi:hypothetical protein
VYEIVKMKCWRRGGTCYIDPGTRAAGKRKTRVRELYATPQARESEQISYKRDEVTERAEQIPLIERE